MSRKYKFRNHEGIYFVSFATVYWIDVFIRNIYRDILIDSWRYCQKEKGLDIYAWVIMSSHVHMIIGSKTNQLEDIVRDMKSFTSRKIRDTITENSQESRREWMLWMMTRAGIKNGNNKGFQFWQQNNHPIELSDNTMMDQKLDYIHYNPVTAGFVEKPEEYIYSSARDYCGIKGLVEVERLY
jgi:REP element-mobilizing transposase RayT